MNIQRSNDAKRVLLASTAVIALWGGATVAQAQSTGTQATVAATSAAASDDSATVGEVVVTAQRRVENLQNVPISITAISGEALKNADINDVSRLEQVVPGLRLGRSGAAERFAIRGVYTEAIGLNSDPRIGFYIDEIYQARTQQTTAALIDLERVEVQKGPQGTLYGRNSYGGNIALTTATPKDHFEEGVDLTGGNYGRFRAEGYLNAPIAPGLAVRVAGEYERHDGYLKSSINSAADLQDKGEYFLRGSLRWVPPSLDGKLEVLLHASYYNRNDNGFNSVNGKVIGVAEDPSLITLPGGTLTYNGTAFTFTKPATGLGGFNGLNLGTGTLYPYTNAVRDGIADVNGADIGIPIPGKYSSVYDAPAHENLSQQQYSGSVSYDLNRWLRLRSITGYTKFSTVNGGDGDGTPLPLQYYVTGTDSQSFSQEFQVQSNDKENPLQYTAGAYYFFEKDRDGSSYYYLNRNYTTANATSLGLPTYYAGTGACQFSYTANAACSLNYATGNLFDSRGEDAAQTQSYAVYAQSSYTIADKLTFTLGGRYTIDHKSFKSIEQAPSQGTSYVGTYVAAQGLANSGNYYAVGPNYSDSFANLSCGGFTAQTYSTAQSNVAIGSVPNYFITQCGARKFEFATYRAAVDYKLTPTNLLYASFSTGRHSGGFGAGAFAATAPTGSFTTFNSEGVRAYEVGSKNQFFDRRLQLNLTAFYNYYTHVQAQGTQVVVVQGVNTNQTTIFNTGSERAPGVEVEIIAKPVRNLTLNVDADYLHARYDQYPAYVPPSFICFYLVGGCTGGTFSTTAPANYGVGGGYFPNAQTNPTQFVATGIAGFNYAYLGSDRRVQNTPDWSVHFGGAYDFDLGRYGRVTPQFNTLWSGTYLLSSAAPNILQNNYFKTDARIMWVSADGRYNAQVFVQNLENAATLGRITTGASGQIQGTYDDPRTYGIKIGAHF